MQKNLSFALILLTLVTLCKSELENCFDKAILSDYGLIHDKRSDVTRAFNGPASCNTLKLSDGVMCCYIKFKFKNEELDKKFTHKGCYEITNDDFNLMNDDFDNLIDKIEDNFNKKNEDTEKLTYKNVDIDCSSKYLHLVGIALLFLLL